MICKIFIDLFIGCFNKYSLSELIYAFTEEGRRRFALYLEEIRKLISDAKEAQARFIKATQSS